MMGILRDRRFSGVKLEEIVGSPRNKWCFEGKEESSSCSGENGMVRARVFLPFFSVQLFKRHRDGGVQIGLSSVIAIRTVADSRIMLVQSVWMCPRLTFRSFNDAGETETVLGSSGHANNSVKHGLSPRFAFLYS
jgi:hypothetical protein